MQPNIYNIFYVPKKTAPQKKAVQLDLRVIDGNVHVVVVDDDGGIVVSLMAFLATEVIAFRNAKNVLEENGYDTGFAQWTRMGKSIIVT